MKKNSSAERDAAVSGESIAVVGAGETMTLWGAIRREWRDDGKDMVKLVSCTPATERRAAVACSLDKGGAG